MWLHQHAVTARPICWARALKASGCACSQVAPPITLEATIRPLLRALPTCPAAAMALVEVAAAMPPHLAASYVLLQLLQAFDPEREWLHGEQSLADK